jgi:NAD(P)-dependent dehydrogenase (short-subunit alcohol dehydrogenase family)
MKADLTGKLALVTGASRGIGRGIAERLAQAGAVIAVHYGKSAAEAGETLAHIKEVGGDGFLVQGDVSTMAGIGHLITELDAACAARDVNHVDILVNNAGVGGYIDISHMTEADYDRIFNTNVKGLLFITQAVLARMPDGGRIINISSMVGHNAYPVVLAYAASKAAVDEITLSMAAGLGGRRITVNAVAPGATQTDFIGPVNDETMARIKSMAALRDIGKPRDIANVVAFLASEEAGWITGERIRASGGMHL